MATFKLPIHITGELPADLLYQTMCHDKKVKDGKRYSNTIKKAITKIEKFAEEQLYKGKPTGAIFWLKNHGWMDQHKLDIKVAGSLTDLIKKRKNGNSTSE